jgi:hypothetical protein
MKRTQMFMLVMVLFFTIFALISCGKEPLLSDDVEQIIFDDWKQRYLDDYSQRTPNIIGEEIYSWTQLTPEQQENIYIRDEIVGVSLERSNKQMPAKYEGYLEFRSTEYDDNYTHDLYASYDGKTIEYYYIAGEWQEGFTVTLSETYSSVEEAARALGNNDTSEDAVPNPTQTVPSTFDEYTANTLLGKFELVHVKIPKKTVKFIRDVADFNDRSREFNPQNAFIPKDLYLKTAEQIVTGYSDAIYNNSLYSPMSAYYFETMGSIAITQFGYLSIDSFPETIYPARMRNAEAQYDDLLASIMIIGLMNQTAQMYTKANSSEEERTVLQRQLNRLKSNLDSGNKALFATIYPQLAKDRKITYKGFYPSYE